RLEAVGGTVHTTPCTLNGFIALKLERIGMKRLRWEPWKTTRAPRHASTTLFPSESRDSRGDYGLSVEISRPTAPALMGSNTTVAAVITTRSAMRGIPRRTKLVALRFW